MIKRNEFIMKLKLMIVLMIAMLSLAGMVKADVTSIGDLQSNVDLNDEPTAKVWEPDVGDWFAGVFAPPYGVINVFVQSRHDMKRKD